MKNKPEKETSVSRAGFFFLSNKNKKNYLLSLLGAISTIHKPFGGSEKFT